MEKDGVGMKKERKKELLSLFGNDNDLKIKYENLIDRLVFLEERLEFLETLPHTKIHPSNPELQKSLPAGREYISKLQQYTNCLKELSRATGTDESDEESPLRKWVKSRKQE